VTEYPFDNDQLGRIVRCETCGAPADRPTLWANMPWRHAETKQITCHPSDPDCHHLISVIERNATE